MTSTPLRPIPPAAARLAAVAAAWAICLALLAPTPARAGGPDSGFYLGGGPSFTWTTGTGTWDVYDFEIDQPLSTESGGALGLAWEDKVLLGLRPIAGYRFDRSFAVQVGYGLNITKSSQQVYSEYNGVAYYEQGMNVEWRQHELEVLGVFHSQSDLGVFFYGGLELVSVETDILLYEGAQLQDVLGDLITSIDYDDNTDDASAAGFVFGAGVELPSESLKTEAFLSVQYSLAKTDETFFGTEGFKVDVGGLSFLGGLKWFPFAR